MMICVVTTYWKKSGGGVAQYVSGLVEELENKGYSLNVFFREGEDPKKNVRIKGNKIVFSVKAFFKIIKLKPKVVHSHGAWYCLLPGILSKKLIGTRTVHTFHTDPKEEKLPFFGRIFMQYLVNNCDCVTFVSKSLKKGYEKYWKLKFHKAEITYPGVKTRAVTEDEKEKFVEKFSLRGRYPVLLLQAFTEHKLKSEGAKLAIQAVKKLKEQYPQIALVITRKGRYLEELRTFALDQGIGDSVIFTGDLENPFVALETCDIYVHTPLGEALGIALLEAMSVGKPIVASNVGGIPEAISHFENGMLVNPSVDEIAASIDYVIKNPTFANKISCNAKKDQYENFTWSVAAQAFIERCLHF